MEPHCDPASQTKFRIGNILLGDPPKSYLWEIGWKILLFLGLVAGFYLRSPNLKEFGVFYVSPGWPDQGAQFLFTWLLNLKQFWVPSHQPSLEDVAQLQAVFVFLLSVAMLVPRVPLAVTIGGQAAILCCWWTFGDISVHCHAIEAWAIVLCSMLVVVISRWDATPRDWAVIVIFGCILGYLPMMRQSVTGTCVASLAPIGCLLVFLVLRQKLTRNPCSPPNSKDRCPDTVRVPMIVRRLGAPLIALALIATGSLTASKMLWSWTHKTPMVTHGVGWSLFLSLGVAKNPHNIVYDDAYAMQQGLFIEGRPYTDSSNPQDLEKLAALWGTLVLEDPAQVLIGVTRRAKYLAQYFTGTLDLKKTASDEHTLQSSWITLGLTLIFFACLSSCLLRLSNSTSGSTLSLAAGGIGLLIAGFFPLLLLVPYRLGSAIGAMLVIVFVLTPAAFSRTEAKAWADFSPTEISNIKFSAFWSLLVLSLIPVPPIFGYVAYRTTVNRTQAQALLNGDALAHFHKLGRRFAQSFNRLSSSERKILLNRLRAPEYQGEVFQSKASEALVASRLASPALALLDENVICLAVKLSKDWQMFLPTSTGGPRHSTLIALKNKEIVSGILLPSQVPYSFLNIHDDNWDGEYTMFCLPRPPNFLDGLNYIGVSAYNFSGGNDNIGLGLDYISGDRLYLNAIQRP